MWWWLGGCGGGCWGVSTEVVEGGILVCKGAGGGRRGVGKGNGDRGGGRKRQVKSKAVEVVQKIVEVLIKAQVM